MATYEGSCHCGKVRFEVDTDLDKVVRCNCSICRRRSAVMTRIQPEHFRLLSGEGELSSYQFHTHKATHYFCRTCGIYPFHRPRSAPDLYVINVGCLAGVDPYSFEPGLIDGESYD